MEARHVIGGRRGTRRLATARLAVAVLAGVVAGCAADRPAPVAPSAPAEDRRPVVVQGAMPVETERFIGRLAEVRAETIGSWTFWHGRLDGYPVIVSRTQKGMASVAAATTLAAERYRPAAIVNQGTAGGHDPALQVYDIVVGRAAVNLGAFKTAYRRPGQGSNPLEWTPLDLLASAGSAAEDPNARTMRRFAADGGLLAAAERAAPLYQRGRVVTGVIGSADVWNSEIDRIAHFRRQFETSVEEMETASAAQVASAFQIPFLGVRVLSNNITNDGAYDGRTGDACQDFVYEVVRAYIGATLAAARP
ncbi:MAG: 5'-methylthioadenosine/S-adenosylhomocysteine nucleosidase [Vicinamibacterales bacterium]